LRPRFGERHATARGPPGRTEALTEPERVAEAEPRLAFALEDASQQCEVIVDRAGE
jgi:hypothetical protein